MEKLNRNVFISEMQKYDTVEPNVGIFWYDPLLNELFQVHSFPVLDDTNFTTYPKLHKTVWQKLRHSTISKKEKGLPHEEIYLKDYTQVPRGRIFHRDGVFYVMVGSWITDKIKEMIVSEFNLPENKTLFGIDSHWEIGHGWSTENDNLNFEEIKWQN